MQKELQKELQKHFIQFHNKIRTDFEDNEILRNKRDLLIRELKAYFKKRSEDTDSPQITFDCFNQGIKWQRAVDQKTNSQTFCSSRKWPFWKIIWYGYG